MNRPQKRKFYHTIIRYIFKSKVLSTLSLFMHFQRW